MSNVLTAAVQELSRLKVPAGTRVFEHLLSRIARLAGSDGLTSVTRTREQLYWTALNLQVGEHRGRDITDRGSIDPLVSKWKDRYTGEERMPLPGSPYAYTVTVEVTRKVVTISLALFDRGVPVSLANPGTAPEPDDVMARKPDVDVVVGRIAEHVTTKLKQADVGELVEFERMVERLEAPAVVKMFRGHLAAFESGASGRHAKRIVVTALLVVATLSAGGLLGMALGKLLRREGTFAVTARLTRRGTVPCVFLDWSRSGFSGHFVVYRDGAALADVGEERTYSDCTLTTTQPVRYNVVKKVLGIETSVSRDILLPAVEPDTEESIRSGGTTSVLSVEEVRAATRSGVLMTVKVGEVVTVKLSAVRLPAPGTPRDVTEPDPGAPRSCTADVDFGAAGRVERVACDATFPYVFRQPGTYALTITQTFADQSPQVERCGDIVVVPASDGAAPVPNAPSR